MLNNIENDIKPAKHKKSRFKRGTRVPCILLSAGEKSFTFLNLLKEENLLTNRTENQKFLITAPPTLDLQYKDRSYPVYVIDTDKGVTVDISISKNYDLATLYCDPKMLSNVFDETFISKASGIKPDVKQLIGVGIAAFIFGGFTGLLF